MSFPGLRTLRMSVRWLRSRCTGGAVILGYHRITEPAWDPYELCVAPRRFAQQLEGPLRIVFASVAYLVTPADAVGREDVEARRGELVAVPGPFGPAGGHAQVAQLA